MNEITELSTAELDQVEGGIAWAFVINAVLAEMGFFAWANDQIENMFS